MFLNSNVDAILFVLTIFVSYNTFANVNQQKEIKKLKKTDEINARINVRNSVWRIEAPKILKIGELNANSIKDLSEQQQLLNRYLGEVLNVSNLIPSKELGIEAIDIIEDLRQRVKWHAEIEEAQKIDEDNYYKGD
jgi:hypothetical protein